MTQLYRRLVPDAPIHRRTEGDEFRARDFARRIAATRSIRMDDGPGALQTPSLVSSCSGRIERILFCFPAWALDFPSLVAGYQSVIAELRPGTRFVVAHNQKTQAQIASWFAAANHPAANVEYVPLPDYVSLTDWAEDAYVCLFDRQGGAGYLMEPWEFPRAGDALIADAVEHRTDLRASQAPLIFQGGNCLIGDEFWLLGKDYFADTLSLLAGNRPPVIPPESGSLDSFAQQLFSTCLDQSRSLRVIGTQKAIPIRKYVGTRTGDRFFLDIPAEGVGTYQPIFHIDMFLTLVGAVPGNRFQVLVGSPALADRELRTESPFALADVYDAIAADLDTSGFDVLRIPLVHQPTLGTVRTLAELRQMESAPDGEALTTALRELIAAGAKESTQVQVRSWHHITWNNCLVENSEEVGKHVYLPSFGHGAHAHLAALDAWVQKFWTDELKFTVHGLADFNEFASRQGVVHCVKKYLARGR